MDTLQSISAHIKEFDKNEGKETRFEDISKKLIACLEEIKSFFDQKPVKPDPGPRKSASSTPRSIPRQEKEKDAICFNCDGQRHKSLKECPKFGTECTWCGIKNHIEKYCRAKNFRDNKKTQEVNTTTSNHGTHQNSHALSSWSSDDKPKGPQFDRTCHQAARLQTNKNDTPRLAVLVVARHGTSFEFDALPDTGATKSLVAWDLLDNLGIPYRAPRDVLFAANGEEMNCVGEVTLKINGVKTVFIVTPSISEDMLLSWHDLVRLDVIPADFPALRKGEKVLQTSHNELDDNVPLEQLLAPIFDEFADIISDTLPEKPMNGKEMTIDIDESKNIVPKKVTTARPVPLFWKKKATDLINSLVADGVIEQVHDETSDWVSPAFFVPKPNGKLRLVTDFTHLNKAIKRPVHPFPSASDIIKDIPAGTNYFLKFDALQGYHQVPLDEASRALTTFLVPMGKFRYKRGPMGLRSTNDVYCARSDRTVKDVEDCNKIIDDILVCSKTKPELCKRAREVLTNCRECNITISKKKIEFGTSIEFAGYHLTPSGARPDDTKIKALTAFPPPTNIAELRSFLGLANQLGGHVKDLALVTDPLRQLLKKGVIYQWSADLQKAFETARSLLSSPQLVHFFDPSLRTVLLSDASCLHGIGFALLQYCENSLEPRLVQCGSRSLTGAESRYAPVELECLGITWAVEKCRHFLMGHPSFQIVTDHAPLLGVFQKDLNFIDNRRLQRFRERLLPYVFNLTWCEGKLHLIADAFSRRPVDKPDDPDKLLVRAVAACDMALRDIIFSASKYDDYSSCVDAILARTPVNSLPPDHPAREYKSHWDKLSVSEDGLIIFDGCRLVIPISARSKVLEFLHQSHCGFFKVKCLAQELYFWPGMVPQIQSYISSCTACNRLQPSLPKEKLKLSSSKFPFDFVGVDLFQAAGQHFLVLVDHFSGFPFVAHLRSLSSSAIIKVLDNWFLDFGYPNRLRSDGGPQFRTEFDLYCSSKNITKETSSPYFAQSNGLAESAVKQTKRLLKKVDFNFQLFRAALLHWRNTPRADGISPSQMLFGFRQNFGQMELLPPAFIDRSLVYKQRHLPTPPDPDRLPPLLPNQRVLIQDSKTGLWDTQGVIDSVRRSGRSYNILSDDNFKMIRNRVFLRPA